MNSIFVALGVTPTVVTFPEVSPTLQKREFKDLRRSTRLSTESLSKRTTGKPFVVSPKSFKHNSDRTSRGKTTDVKYNKAKVIIASKVSTRISKGKKVE